MDTSFGHAQLHDMDNNFPISFADSTDTTSVHALSVDTSNRVRLDRQNFLGAREPISFYLNAAGALTTQCIFIATRPMVITAIEELHSTAETAAGTCTLAVFKDTGTVVPGGGATTMVGTINLKGTANTLATATLLSVDSYGQPNAGITLAAGDRLSIVVGGTATVTALAGVSLTVWVAPGLKEVPAIFQMKANAGLVTQGFFQANTDLVITAAPYVVWSTAGTDSGTVTVDIFHDSSTNAPGAGSSILAAALSVKTTSNTVSQPALTATTSRLTLRAGDRLSVKFTGTTTSLAGMVIVVPMACTNANGYAQQVEATFALNANASLGTQGFFIADRPYEVMDVSAIWSAAGTDGGTVTYDVTIDKGVVAPGAGSSVLSAAVSAKTTANTSSIATLNASRRNRLLSVGDLLSFKPSGTLTSLAGMQLTVSLLPR